MFIDIDESNKDDFNKVVSHPLQSFEWGEFRKKTGVKVVRRGMVSDGKIIDGFTLTIHKIPKTKYYIGYLGKGNEPTKEILEELQRIGIEENCVFIQLEPAVRQQDWKLEIAPRSPVPWDRGRNWKFRLVPAAHPLFTKYTFVLDLTKTEEEIMAAMHSKTRYNIRVAEKHKVKVVENNSEESFKHYMKLMLETTQRQGFYAHTPKYHRDMWETLGGQKTEIGKQKSDDRGQNNNLSIHLFNALFTPSSVSSDISHPSSDISPLTLTSWMLFVFHDHLYYPYGASSREHRETMSNNLTAWEAIKFGKKHGLKKFDMWGALGPDPDKNDPWYGFHRFKEGYGAELVEFVGSYDLIIRPQLYSIYKIADKARWGFLKIRKKLTL